ncbi:ABC transporter ATP-binding protein, partial [Brevibacterium paucivorans]
LFLALKKNTGLTALVITHDLGLAWNIADTVAVMYRGEIVEHGPVEDVLLNPQHDYTRKLLAAVPGFRSERAVPGQAAQATTTQAGRTDAKETGGAVND